MISTVTAILHVIAWIMAPHALMIVSAAQANVAAASVDSVSGVSVLTATEASMKVTIKI